MWACALVGIGIAPGAADVFARHAADELFSETVVDYFRRCSSSKQ